MFAKLELSLIVAVAVCQACSSDESANSGLNAGDSGSHADSPPQTDATADSEPEGGCSEQRIVELVGANGLTEETNLLACVIRPDPDYESTTRIDRTGGSLCSPDAAKAPCGSLTPDCHECVDNAQCGPGRACLCAAAVPTNTPVNGYMLLRSVHRCVPSECESSADCNGLPCGFSDMDCENLYLGFFCRTPEDECQTDADCWSMPNTSSGHCIYNTSKGLWACSPPGYCH